jgi:hypothetical protein
MSTVMSVSYPDDITLREARSRYFEANGFGPTGGYDDKWVDFKLGPLPFPFPNSPARVKAVRYHDLHHVLTTYRTDIVGEFEISAWEIAAGCKSMAAAWVLNLGGLAGGLFRCPKRTFAAFVRGRRHRTLYDAHYEQLLDMTVGEARAKYTPAHVDLHPRASDVLLFALSAFTGSLVGWLTFSLMLPLVPVGLLTHHFRKRAAA